jgi:hypothetical protein
MRIDHVRDAETERVELGERASDEQWAEYRIDISAVLSERVNGARFSFYDPACPIDGLSADRHTPTEWDNCLNDSRGN